MEIKKISLIALIALVSFSCKSSSDDPEPPKPQSANAKANTWMYKQMKENYYWYDKMPKEESSTNQELNPDAYFASLLFKDDGFSKIKRLPEPETRADANGYVAGHGILETYWTSQDLGENVLMQIIYVVPGSPADKAGIKRSRHFSHCNGRRITLSNYKETLLSQEIALTPCDSKGNVTGEDISFSQGSYYNTPILCDTVYQINGKNIGYLFYSTFHSAKGDSNDVDLRNAIGKMAANNVEELIVDLRFNGGGLLNLSVELASMLVPKQYGTKDIFLYMDRPPVNKYEHISFFNVSNRLDLNNVHFITNEYSASASEITLYGLRQFFPNLKHYGEVTVGKNVGSHAISGEKEKVYWELNAITSRFYDQRGKGVDNWQTFTGLKPDFFYDELDKFERDGQWYAQDRYRGQLGEYDPEKDYDGVLNFVMAKMGYTTEVVRYPTRSASVEMRPVFARDLTRDQVLIVE